MKKTAMAALKNELFSGEPATVFAIVDGAATTTLTQRLASHPPRHACLYAGDLSPDLAEVAPYLALLERDEPFTEWLLGNGWGRGWGIYGKAGCRFTELRSHFRRMAKVAEEATGRALYFRFYDPKLLAIYLSGCSRKELRNCFGPVLQYLVEDAVSGSLTRMYLVDDELRQDSVPLGQREWEERIWGSDQER